MLGLGARLYHLQIVKQNHYQLLAEGNRLTTQILPPLRGRIFDRFGMELAVNRFSYQVHIVPERAAPLEKTLHQLADILDIEPEALEPILEKTSRLTRHIPLLVRDNLTWEEVCKVEIFSPSLAGVEIQTGFQRFYPVGVEAAHLVGHVGAANTKEVGTHPLYPLPGFKIGKVGIERKFEDRLRGIQGKRTIEINAVGRIIKEVERTDAQPGQDMTLSIDLAIQRIVVEELNRYRRAAGVVLDATNGEILALASIPFYDPNFLTRELDQDLWRSFSENPDHSQQNKALSGQYAPGSTFKIVVALAALERGLSPDTEHHCNGSLPFYDRLYHCWNRRGHGRMNLHEALRESCDVWFYRVGQELGVDTIAHYARELGLGQVPGPEFEEARAGLIPTVAWKNERFGETWYGGETLIAAIGQGYCLVTPFQLAVMMARLYSSRGLKIEPTIHKRTQALGQNAFQKMDVSQAHLEIIREALHAAVNHEKGTGYRAVLPSANWQMSGKTGTSQVRTISLHERRSGVLTNEEVRWHQRDHALFVGSAFTSSPRYVMSIVLEHGKSGLVAALSTRNILTQIQKLDRNHLA